MDSGGSKCPPEIFFSSDKSEWDQGIGDGGSHISSHYHWDGISDGKDATQASPTMSEVTVDELCTRLVARIPVKSLRKGLE